LPRTPRRGLLGGDMPICPVHDSEPPLLSTKYRPSPPPPPPHTRTPTPPLPVLPQERRTPSRYLQGIWSDISRAQGVSVGFGSSSVPCFFGIIHEKKKKHQQKLQSVCFGFAERHFFPPKYRHVLKKKGKCNCVF